MSITEVVQNPSGPYMWPGGTPTIQSGVIIPDYPTGVTYYKGSSWVNGFGNTGTSRINHHASITSKAIGADHPSVLYSGGPSMTDGDHSFYFVVTPSAYGSDPLGLIHSESNDGLVIRLNNGSSQMTAESDTAPLVTHGSSPTAGTPVLVAVRTKQSASLTIDMLVRSNRGASSDTSNAYWNPTPAIIFDDTAAQTGGIELFGEMTSSGAGTNAINNMAQNGFIVHEVLIYPKHLSTSEHDDVVQWFEDRYGV